MSAVDGMTVAHGLDARTSDAPQVLARLRTFHTLDALRGVAALVVLFFHAGFFFGVAPPAEGYLAVDLFFAMSGFVIAYRYEADLERGLGLGAFVALRLRRLYPLFLLGTILGVLPALAVVAGGHADHLHQSMLAALPPALLMLPSHAVAFAQKSFYPLNFVSWSLALEILVNVAWAATHRVWNVRNLLYLLAASLLCLSLVAFTNGSLNVGYNWDNALGGLPRVIYGFGFGVLLFKLREAPSRLPRVPWWSLVVLVPALLVLDPTRLGVAWARPAFDIVFVALVVPAVVRAALSTEPSRAARGLCTLAGVYSYVLYSLHVGFIGLYLRFEERLHLDLSTISPLRTLAFAVGLAALCWVAHVGYDKPVRRWLGRRRAPARRDVLQAATDK